MNDAATDGTTIFALATGMGRSAVAVMRLSGPACGRVVTDICGLPPPRTASLRILRDRLGAVIDRALVLWFPEPGSYTGEDVAELHVHGGPAVLDALTDTLLGHGLRPAEAGEFTRRAFSSGKIDLLAAEAISDLIAAETPKQRAQALQQLDGAQSRLLASWSNRLLRALALQEAMIDFLDEDLPELEAQLLQDLDEIAVELSHHTTTADTGERLRRGLVFTITGPPNVGKSSLLNALAGRDAAIVSASPGTTRDVVSVDLVLAGIPVTIVDTAGIRETEDEAEAEGVRRAREQVTRADYVIEVGEASSGKRASDDPERLQLFSKTDLCPSPRGCVGVSAETGAGMAELKAELAAVATRLAGSSSTATFNRARHATALGDAWRAVSAALEASSAEIRAEDLRVALRSLGRLSGQSETDDMLDLVFNAFCIGK